MKALLEEFKNSMKDGNHGRFSRDSFEEMATAILNSTETTQEWSMTSEGEVKQKDFQPSEGLRKFIYNTLKDFGVDSESASAVLGDEYKFRKLSGIHEFISETLYNYAKYRRFNFINKEHFTGSLTISDVEGSTKEYRRIPKKDEEVDPTPIRIQYGEHEKIRVKSSAPEWVKTRLN